jgi:uncharacterized protein YuzE
MRIKYSPDVDILVVELDGGVIDYAEEREGVIAHFDRKGAPVLFEIQGAKNFVLGSITSMVNNEEVVIP